MNDRNLEAVARALAAGRAVDWDHVEVDVPDPAAAALLQELRVVAEIASFHKSPATPHRDVPAHIASDHWGRLRITRLIGSGSFGDVFEAYEPALDRLVALKLLRCAGTTTDALNAEVIEEGRTLARVRHPHVVTVFGAARIDGSAGIWMELIHGRTLASRVAELGPMDATDAARTVRDVCLGLAAVHDAGVVHRDVKAQNVMQGERGRVVLMDFGASLDASTGETALAGTPAYVAPEILCGSQATFQSDIYSVGVLLFYLTTGSYPVSGASIAEVRSRHAQGSRVALRQANARLPRSLAAIVDRALAQTPGDRFASARELADALDGFQRTAFRRPAAVFATALIACTAIAGLAISARVPKKSPSGGMRPMVLVGSFDNRTGTPLFNGTIEAALQYALARSSRLTVMPSTRIDDALNLMKRSPDTPLTPVLARDVARRDGGVAFLIIGTVDKVDADTVISAQIVPAAGAAMPQWVRVHASSDAEAPAAVWELAREMRARLGDARDAATRQGGRPISLDSVRSYTDAVRLGNRGQWRGALEQARQAAIDHRASAMAQIWLAWCEFNTRAREEGLRTAAAAESAAQGDEVPNDEREWILGSAADLRGDSERAVRHYENVLKDRPDDAWIVNRTAILYYNAGATAQAVMMGGRAADLRPNDFHQQVLTTRWLLQAGDDAARVAHYAQRALRLLDKDTANALPIDASFALLVPAELAWRARDATGTSNALVAGLFGPSRGG